MIYGAMLTPPEGWREREDAQDFSRRVAELAFAEAEVLRAEERLRISAPTDPSWEAMYAFEDAYSLLAALGATKTVRDRAVRSVQDKLIEWHDQDRKAG